MFLIYKYTNERNGKGYIGLTKNEQSRKYNHRSADGNCRAFYNAIKKYGFDSFVYEVLESGIPTKELVEEQEQFYIREHNTYKNGYNLTKGGFCGGSPEGEKSPHAKLTEKQAKMTIADSRPNCELAREFNVDDNTIWNIRNGKTWKHLDRSKAPQYKKVFRLSSTEKEFVKNDRRSNGEIANILGVDHSLISYYRRGIEKSYNSKKTKLSEENAIQIIHDPRPHSNMANELDVSISTIRAIRYGTRWKHLNRNQSISSWRG